MNKILFVLAAIFALAIADGSIVNYHQLHHSCTPRKKAPFFQATAVLHGKFTKVSLEIGRAHV